MNDHNVLSIVIKYSDNIKISWYNNKDTQIVLYIIESLLEDKGLVPFSIELIVETQEDTYNFKKFDSILFKILKSKDNVKNIYINILEYPDQNIKYMKSQMFVIDIKNKPVESRQINNSELIRLGYPNMCDTQ